MIGYEMLYTVAVGIPLFIGASIGAHFLRSHGQCERGVWLLALVLAVALPTLALSRPDVPEPTVWTPIIESGVIALPALAPVASAAPASPAIEAEEILMRLWLLASLLLAVRWALSSFQLARVSRGWRSETIDGVPVLLTPGLGPAVFGITRPRIIVPSWVSELPPARRALVLLHEQEHLRAGDHRLIALARFARILTPWNPVTWLLSWRLRRAIELDCDRRVLRSHPDVEAYGATLLTVSARASGRLLAAAAFAESEVPLRRRILAMTTPPRPLSAFGLMTTIALGVILVSGALAVPSPSLVQTQLPEPRIIRDPGAMLVPTFDAQNRIESAVMQAPVGSWYPMGRRGTIGMIVRPLRPGLDWGVALPVREDDQLRLLTETPRILNPEDIARAIREEYPARLRDQGLGATVGVAFLVGVTGEVERTVIRQVSAFVELDQAALAVADVYRFSAAVTDGAPVAVWVSHPIDFRVP